MKYPRLCPEERGVLATRAARADADARLGTSRRELARYRRKMEFAELLALSEWDDELTLYPL